MAVRTETSILLVEEAARVRANSADQMRKDAEALRKEAAGYEKLAADARARAATMTQTAEQTQWEAEDLADQAVRMRREKGLNGPVAVTVPSGERPTVAWPPVPVEGEQGAPLPPAVIDHHTTGEYARHTLGNGEPAAETTRPDAGPRGFDAKGRHYVDGDGKAWDLRLAYIDRQASTWTWTGGTYTHAAGSWREPIFCRDDGDGPSMELSLAVAEYGPFTPIKPDEIPGTEQEAPADTNQAEEG